MDQSLQELENSVWPDQTDASPVMQRILALRKIPLSQLSASDIRLLISQKMSLEHVLEAAMRILEESPLIEADHYKGDLLCTVLDLPDTFWQEHPDLKNYMIDIKREFEIMLDTIEDDIVPRLSSFES